MAGRSTASPGSSWTSYLSSIASFNGDLSTLTAPPFILSGTSLTEFSKYWCQHPHLFVAPAHEPDAGRRAAFVLQWFLSTLKGQYAARSEKYGNEKKPLNPFLGELFLGYWEEEDNADTNHRTQTTNPSNTGSGRTELISEQVSHHPPATAYCIRNEKTGIHLEGYGAQKASFTKTINIKQLGHALLHLPAHPNGPQEEETYLITLPALRIEGLLFGAPYIELLSSSYITSSSGYTARIDYSGKGWISGKRNSVSAVIYPTGKENEILYNATGVWSQSFSIYRGSAKTNSPKTLFASFEASADPIVPLTVAPEDQQHPLESRRAWLPVAHAIEQGNLEAVSREKTAIEQAQRQLRQRERDEGRTWERLFFTDVLAKGEAHHEKSHHDKPSHSKSHDKSHRNKSHKTHDKVHDKGRHGKSENKSHHEKLEDKSPHGISENESHHEKSENESHHGTPETTTSAAISSALKRLGPAVGLPENGDADKTGGLWRFDAEKAKKTQKALRTIDQDGVKAMEKEILGRQ